MKDVKEYIRTDLSDEQEAIIGRCGCGAESQARDKEGGVQGERRVSLPGVVDADDVGEKECEVVGEGNEVVIVSGVKVG